MVNYTPKTVNSGQSAIDKQTDQLVGDFIEKSGLTLKKDQNMESAIKQLVNHKATGLPVVADDGKLLGVLSEKDCLKFAFDMRYFNEGHMRVEQYMSAKLITLGVNDNILQVAELFIKNQYQMYPVVDEDGHLLGVMTRRSALKAMAKMNQTTW